MSGKCSERKKREKVFRFRRENRISCARKLEAFQTHFLFLLVWHGKSVYAKIIFPELIISEDHKSCQFYGWIINGEKLTLQIFVDNWVVGLWELEKFSSHQQSLFITRAQINLVPSKKFSNRNEKNILDWVPLPKWLCGSTHCNTWAEVYMYLHRRKHFNWFDYSDDVFNQEWSLNSQPELCASHSSAFHSCYYFAERCFCSWHVQIFYNLRKCKS